MIDKDLKINCKLIDSVTTQKSWGGSSVYGQELLLTEVDISELLSQIELDEIFEYFGKEKVLDTIGQDFCVEHFDLEEDE